MLVLFKRSLSLWQSIGMLAVWSCSLTWSSAAYAQTSRIMLVSASDVPDELKEAVTSTVAALGDMVSTGSYVAAARGQNLAPEGAAALTKIGVKVKSRLMVVLESTRGKLHVTFRDGVTGQVIDEESLPAHGRRPRLSRLAEKKLNATARSALSKASPQPQADFVQATAPKPAPRPTPAAPVRAPVRPAPMPQSQPKPQQQASQDEEEEDEEGEGEQQPAAKPEKADSGDSGVDFVARLSLAGGVGARSVSVPARDGAVTADTGFAPALMVGADVFGVLGGHLLLGATVEYRTFFGLHMAQQSPTGETTQVGVTSHSIIVGAAPGYRWGGPGTTELHVLIGWATRSLTPPDSMLPGANAQGLLLRPDLRIAVANGVVILRLAPELILSLGTSSKLYSNVPGLAQAGFGYGGILGIDFRLGSSIFLGLEIRESHIQVASAWSASFQDMERYATVKLTIQF
jgi:hypothetical protein